MVEKKGEFASTLYLRPAGHWAETCTNEEIKILGFTILYVESQVLTLGKKFWRVKRAASWSLWTSNLKWNFRLHRCVLSSPPFVVFKQTTGLWGCGYVQRGVTARTWLWVGYGTCAIIEYHTNENVNQQWEQLHIQLSFPLGCASFWWLLWILMAHASLVLIYHTVPICGFLGVIVSFVTLIQPWLIWKESLDSGVS